jgi:YaiO family outer membrane protein
MRAESYHAPPPGQVVSGDSKSYWVNKMEQLPGSAADPGRGLQVAARQTEIMNVTTRFCRPLAARLAILVLSGIVAGATPAGAQPADVRVSARSAATSGHRAEALSMLEGHLKDSPRDADARLLLGVILSWEGRYDDADRELRRVLEQSPTYNDARVALANVAWWTGRYDELQRLAATGRSQRPSDVEWMMQEARALDGLGQRREARDLVITMLARQPGHVNARALKQRLDGALRPWSVTAGFSGDRFSDARTPWSEYAVSLNRQTPVGTVIGRVSQAGRFGLSDRLFEIEAYPTLRPGTNAYVAIGFAQDDTLFPNYRAAADLYQSLGRGFEASIGMRRLGFSTATDIYVGSLTKYVGNWMLTAKAFSVPDFEGPEDSLSYHGVARRYVRGDGESFWGVGYSRGYSREELGDRAELLQLGADTLRANTEILIGRYVVAATGSTSRQERAGRSTLWQHSFGASLTVQF